MALCTASSIDGFTVTEDPADGCGLVTGVGDALLGSCVRFGEVDRVCANGVGDGEGAGMGGMDIVGAVTGRSGIVTAGRVLTEATEIDGLTTGEGDGMR